VECTSIVTFLEMPSQHFDKSNSTGTHSCVCVALLVKIQRVVIRSYYRDNIAESTPQITGFGEEVLS